MITLIGQIRNCIEKKLDEGYRKFIVFPFGDIGTKVKHELNEIYGIQEAYILDNHLCKYNANIQELSVLEKINCADYCIILSSINTDIYEDLKKNVQQYFQDENIAELSSMTDYLREKKKADKKRTDEYVTQIGKYSYGPLCRNHQLIESIGSFCSFAMGTYVVLNHEMRYITTHPMIYAGANLEKFKKYEEYKNALWYFEGIQPQKEKLKEQGRIKIGNDVWLGRNVIITNYANIGNGVIAGAGSIITKDVPDYAVVGGVPARVIRYRYLPEEIESLNRISWWDWEDEEIRERYNDFYLPISEFIKKYDSKR